MFATGISKDGDGVSALILSPRPNRWVNSLPVLSGRGLAGGRYGDTLSHRAASRSSPGRVCGEELQANAAAAPRAVGLQIALPAIANVGTLIRLAPPHAVTMALKIGSASADFVGDLISNFSRFWGVTQFRGRRQVAASASALAG